MSEYTDRRILNEGMGCKPMRRAKSQRAKQEAAQKRSECCRAWRAHIETGMLGPRKIYGAGEKLFSSGRVRGEGIRIRRFGRRNAWGRSELPNDLALRGGGVWQGERSATAPTGLSYSGKGAIRFAPSGAKINSREYIVIVWNRY